MSQTATIGHNNPPSEIEILHARLDDYIDEEIQFRNLSEAELPDVITSDEEAGKVSDHIKSANGLSKRIDDIHKKEKAPFWDAGKAADEWKNAYQAKIKALVLRASPLVLTWNKKKADEERERQMEIARKAREDAEKLAAQAQVHHEAGIEDTAQELMEASVQSDQKAMMIQNNALDIKARSIGGFSSSSTKKVYVGQIESMAAIDLEALRKYLKEDDVLAALNRAVRDGVRELRGAIINQEEKLTVR